ncbi:MAG: hypothetical protein MJA31_20045 [Clostridia bacterium]|nr:hypothetical protein [Clostridia bacterium]
MNYLNNFSYLDRIRFSHGTNQLRTDFYQIGQRDRQEAVKLINEKRLRFYSLFALLPEIQTLDLYGDLNSRNINALKTCAQILQDKKLESKVTHLHVENKEMTHQALKWMVETGSEDDGYNDDFDGVIDSSVALLTQTYQDKTVLPKAAELIFKRNKRGLLIHDLTWGFFQSKDPVTLTLVAQYLLSPEKKDVKLARNLLNYDRTIGVSKNTSNRKLYASYLSWLNDNYSFLYFTGESFQLTSRPTPYRVDLGSKYLCKSIYPHNKTTIVPLTERESRCLEAFNKLDASEQNLLSQTSLRIYKTNFNMWREWIKQPVRQQIKMAKAGLGGNTR